MKSLALLPLTLALVLPAAATDLVLNRTPAQVFFSPRGGCTEAVVTALAGARKSVLVQAYSFTSAPIAGALKAAHDRGVDVRVILDRSQVGPRYTIARYLGHAGIPTWVDTVHGLAHNKVMILDGRTVITGSFNFTKAAEESNAENLLVLQDPALAQLYTQNWQARLARSAPVPVQ